MKQEIYQYARYTNNMYLNSRSRLWSYLNNKRLDLIKSLLCKYDDHFEEILEFGAYDLYFPTEISEFISTKGCKKYSFTDVYDQEDILILAKNNMSILEKRFDIMYNIVRSTGEDIDKKIEDLYTSVFIFETLEHVQDENKVIENINKLLCNGGFVFVGVPQEFGLMFPIKEFGRYFILRRRRNSIKDSFYSTFGRMDKVNRVVGEHEGYDYRRTKDLFLSSGFELLEERQYPSRIFSYGVVLVFKKVEKP